MKCKRITTVLLQIALAITCTAQQQPAETNEQLSAPEELETRALAADFIARFEDTTDISPLIKHMYTVDFTRRLRSVENGAIGYPFATLDGSVIKGASDEELVRFYAETINFVYLAARHYSAALWLKKQSGDEEGFERGDLTIAEALPADAVNVLRTNQILKEFFRDERSSVQENKDDGPNSSMDASKDGAARSDDSNQSNSSSSGASPNSGTDETSDDKNVIKTRGELRSYVSTLEQANSLLRKTAKSLLTMKTLMEVMERQHSEEEKDSLSPRVHLLAARWFDYPAGQRLICVDALLFHMDLVAVDGRLQIATLYLPSD